MLVEEAPDDRLLHELFSMYPAWYSLGTYDPQSIQIETHLQQIKIICYNVFITKIDHWSIYTTFSNSLASMEL